MSTSYQLRLCQSEKAVARGAERRWLRRLMLPFEVLYRHRWSAPWAQC